MTLSFAFAAQRGEFSLEAKGEVAGVTGLFGPSGAGKSTLIHLLAGLILPRRGRLTLGGETLVDTDTGTFVPPHRRRIGVVFQEGRLFPHLSVRENILYGHRPGGLGEDEVVGLLGLPPLLARLPASLSAGERGRVALGRALMANPNLILLDEPLANLDLPARRRILPYLRQVSAAAAVPMLYVSHDLGEVLYLTDNLLFLDKGRLAGSGPYVEQVMAAGGLARWRGLGLRNVLRLEVKAAGGAGDLAVLTLPGEGGEMYAPAVAAAAGEMVSVSLRPADVALVQQPVAGSSIQNQWEGEVVAVAADQGRAIALVSVGNQRLLAELSTRAVADLSLAPGSRVWCLCKARAVQSLDA